MQHRIIMFQTERPSVRPPRRQPFVIVVLLLGGQSAAGLVEIFCLGR